MKVFSNKLSKKGYTILLKVIITFIFMLFINKTVSWNELKTITLYLKPFHLTIISLLCILNLFLHVERWVIILKYMEFEPNKKSAWYSILWGTLLAFITPGRVGELFRGMGTVKGDNIDSMFGVILDKLFILSTVFFWGVSGALFQFVYFNIAVPKTITVASIIILITGLLFFLVLYNGRVLKKTNKISIYFNKTVGGIHRLRRPAGIKAFIYSFGAHFCLLSQSVILLHMFGCKDIIKLFTATAQGYGILPFLSFSIGELGVREGAVVFFMENLNIEAGNEISLKGAALGMSLIIVMVNLILPSFAGLMWNIFKKD